MSCPRLFEPVDAKHLETCAECRAVQESMQVPALAPAELDKLKGPALKELSISPTARPWWAGSAGVVALTALGAGVAMQLLPSNTTQHASAMLRQVSAAAWAVAMGVGAFVAMMPGRRGARLALLGGVGACFALTLAAASGFDPGAGDMTCSLIEWAAALVPLVVALAVLSGFQFDATRALAAGAAAMSGGMLAVHLHCPNGTLFHQGVFHLAPIALVAVLAVGIRRLLPSRSFAP